MSFADIANRQVEDIQEPKTIPSGTWRLQIVSGKLKEGRNVDAGGPVAEVLFALRPVEATNDVNEAEFEAFADQLEGALVYHKIAIWDKRSEWNVLRFLGTAGVELEQGASFVESIEAAKGFEVAAYLSHGENPNDPDHPYVNVENVQAA